MQSVNWKIFLTTILILEFWLFLFKVETTFSQESSSSPSSFPSPSSSPILEVKTPKVGVPVSPKTKFSLSADNNEIIRGFIYQDQILPFGINLNHPQIDLNLLLGTNSLEKDQKQKGIEISLSTGGSPGYSLFIYQDQNLTSKEGEIIPNWSCQLANCQKKDLSGFGFAFSGIDTLLDSKIHSFPNVSLLEKPLLLASGRIPTTETLKSQLETFFIPKIQIRNFDGYQNIITLVAVPNY